MNESWSRTWRVVALAAVATAGSVGCGGGDAPSEVATGQAPPAPSTTTVAAAGDPGPSPVAGLDAQDLRDAVTAPSPPAGRRARGPVAEAVALADGRTVWRVRIPGAFPARSARATVTVGGRDLGPATTPPTLDALVAVSTTADDLVPGAPVSYRWGGDDPVAAGPLEVVR